MEPRNIFRSVPPYYFGVAERRPEGLVDILLLGDSTTALVNNPGPPLFEYITYFCIIFFWPSFL